MPTTEVICIAEEEKTDPSPISEKTTSKSENHNGKPKIAENGITRCITPFPKRCRRSKNL